MTGSNGLQGVHFDTRSDGMIDWPTYRPLQPVSLRPKSSSRCPPPMPCTARIPSLLVRRARRFSLLQTMILRLPQPYLLLLPVKSMPRIASLTVRQNELRVDLQYP